MTKLFQPVPAVPYDWPFDGDLRSDNTALIIIDMQIDFCGFGGYCDMMGVDITLTRRPIDPLRRALDVMRENGFFILYTREGHRSDLADLNENKLWRSVRNGAEIGTKGPAGRLLVRSEHGWEIVPELAPREGEPIIDKAGKGAFYATDFDHILRSRGIRNLVLGGVTTDCCVYTTLQAANDRGYECLLLEDCCAASEIENHEAVVRIAKSGFAQYGPVSSSDKLLAAFV